MQVYGIGADEKRGVTICLTTTAAGTLLPMLIIFGGKTALSLPAVEVREAAKRDGHICTPTPVRHTSVLGYTPANCFLVLLLITEHPDAHALDSDHVYAC